LATNADAARERITQIFKFLEAFNQRRNPVVRRIEDQPMHKWWDELPDHELIKRTPLEDPPPEAADETTGADDYVLKVGRPDIPAAPEPTSELRPWLPSTWDDPSREPTFESPADSADANPPTELWETWISHWKSWATEAAVHEQARALFAWFFDVHTTLGREAERFELMVGDGLLSWPSATGESNHPIIIQRLQLNYDPAVPEFTVTESDRPPDLFAALLREMGIDGHIVASLAEQLEERRVQPLGASSLEEFLRLAIQSMSPTGQVVDHGELNRASNNPRIARRPVIFLQSRALGYAAAIENILADIPTRESFSDALAAIAGVHPAVGQLDPDGTSLMQADEDASVLLSKEANAEQLQIARRLDNYGAVLVQGPPGTGKTHTIANLIGHLLAQGKSVLVTSQTTKALRVLREQVVPQLQPLCVSILEGDAAGRAQLASSIAGISARVAGSNREQLREEANALRSERAALIARINECRLQLLNAVLAEYSELALDGDAVSAETAAREVGGGIGLNDWIPGTVVDAPMPLSLAEVEALYATNALLSSDDERYLGIAAAQSRRTTDARRIRGVDYELNGAGTCWRRVRRRLLARCNTCRPRRSRGPWPGWCLRIGLPAAGRGCGLGALSHCRRNRWHCRIIGLARAARAHRGRRARSPGKPPGTSEIRAADAHGYGRQRRKDDRRRDRRPRVERKACRENRSSPPSSVEGPHPRGIG
jgi:hypothetical protein